MSTPLKRTSMALDQESLRILEDLSCAWGVSKAEVIRRSLKKSDEEEASQPKKNTPLEALKWLQKNGISAREAEIWNQEIRAEREAWRDPWAEYLNDNPPPENS